MKVIDLLNKIANGEEVPEEIKIRGRIFKLDKDYKEYNINYVYQDIKEDYWLDNVQLDEEVITLKEDKEIEEIYHCCMETDNQEIKFCIQNINVLADKTKEIIKILNELKKGK